MKKKRGFAILLWCLAAAGTAFAVEVINIDFNSYGNDTAYQGEGVFPGRTDWIAFYGGWGVPVGSQRSSNLVKQGQGAAPSTYAAQVWIGDDGLGHGYIAGSGSGLMDDGFVNTIHLGGLSDPNIAFMGEGAYGGNFDLIVYGSEAGTFTLADSNDIILGTASVSGGVSEGFVEGGNYVVFENVPLGNPNMIRLYYTNVINGLQLVSTKRPFVISPSSDPNDNTIDARNYDVAFDTNGRGGEITFYGPDLGNYVHYLDTGEYMIYDLFVPEDAQGKYLLSADFVTLWGAAGLNMYLDGKFLGTLTQAQHQEDPKVYHSLEELPVNLFAGPHDLKWANTELYFDVVRLQLVYVGPISLDNCEDVYLYELEPAGDLNRDCRVDLADLAEMVNSWLVDYNPNVQ
ncbi:MAG TPA: hypothetical protein PLX18_10530 [Anaerohalosphaeraceae bacterium]|nr:hypothetical protein [Anaerohalosphaeraceae bacterium]HQG04841.1 hypothetical protein [Anaerohalosphaeraceae bacterium]HQI08275.1 hypothetical protein [Anaerohalosphaeraceae bacterium]HQJ68606.1 hypothetical protein [Anaerohalosphaeraceae bacterium]